MRYIKLFENFIEDFFINGNKYFFEIEDPEDDKGYCISWGVGDIKDDNYSKFGRTDRNEQFLIFKEVRKLFKEWFVNINPDKFYFSVPGEKRMNIYIENLKNIIGDSYLYYIQETDYPPFDIREDKVYYVVFKKK